MNDGLEYVCTNCGRFTDIQHDGFIDVDGDFVENGAMTKCCHGDFEEFSEYEVEDFQEEIASMDFSNLSERERFLFIALKQGDS